MKAFRLLMKVHGVEDYLAFATSALRGAKNCSQVVERVFNKSKIQIEIIDGKKEAKIISNTNVFENIDIDSMILEHININKAIRENINIDIDKGVLQI